MMHGMADSAHSGSDRARLAFMQLVPARLHGLAAVAPQLSRYTLVSAVALALDFAVFLALTTLAMWPPLAGVIGYAAGTVLHYLLSVRFVFDASATDKAHSRLFSEFAVTGVSGMAATAIVIAAATDLASVSALPAKVLAAGVSFLLVFALRRGVVFSARGVPGEAAAAPGRLVALARALLDQISRKHVLPPPAPDFYAKFIVAAAVFFAVLELTYFLFSDLPSFWKPSLDAFGKTAIGRDFLNAWMGGRSALGEGPAAWFDHRVYNQHLLDFIGVADMHSYVWSYPPHVVLLLWPLGLLPYLPAFVLWTLCGVAVFLYAAARGGVERKHLLFIAIAPAAAIDVFIGQNGFFTAAILICGLVQLDRRPLLSGLLFGILTIKPQLGLLLPLMLAMTGRWRTMLAAAATTAALVAATAWLYGPDVWTQCLAKVVPQQQFIQEHGDGLLLLQISSAFYAARLVGLSSGAAWALQAVVSAVAIAAVIWTFRCRRDPVLSMALLIAATFLVTPYSLNYDMVVLGWVLALLRQREGNEPIDHYLIIAVWTLPLTMMLAGLIHIPLAMPVLAAFAARLVWQLAAGERNHRPVPVLDVGGPAKAVPAE
jgi:alpha-1,2-mannosyltransferase